MSRVSLTLPAGVRLTTVDASVAELARKLGCKVVASTDPFGNRSYELEPISAPPQTRKVVMFPRSPGWPSGGGVAA